MKNRECVSRKRGKRANDHASWKRHDYSLLHMIISLLVRTKAMLAVETAELY